jgi:hypothetical protein
MGCPLCARSRHRSLIDQLAAEHVKISRMINAANRLDPLERVDRWAVANAAGFCDLYLLKPNIDSVVGLNAKLSCPELKFCL